MNWSAYSRYVGDIFGAPLAMEGLAAFFLESTFLGLWIFGWDRLKPKVHLATIWLVAIGTTLSAYFILAANSWMQHPVGYKINPVTHRAEMTSIAQILTNSTLIRAFGHTIAAAALTGAMLVLGVAAWHLRRGRRRCSSAPSRGSRSGRRSSRRSSTVLLGHTQGQLMTKQQPMKMAAAEALYDDEDGRAVLALRHRPVADAPVEVARLDRRSRTASRSSPTTRGTARCSGSTTSRPRTSRSTARATTGRSSASPTGASGS